MDIKEYIEKIVDRVKDDKTLLTQFQKDPVKAVEKILGVDLPDELIEKVADGVKAKLAIEDVSDALGMLKKLF